MGALPVLLPLLLLSAACVVGLLPFATAQITPPASIVTNRPVLGILTLPCDDDFCNGYTSYFPASYVKFIESGGARVVPIHYESTPDEFDTMLGMVNGVLFTGGGASLGADSAYFKAVKHIYDYVVDANNNGDYFPLWGTCLGFESLVVAQSQDNGILDSFSAENITLALDYTPAAKTSRIFNFSRYGAADAYNIMGSLNVTMNMHVMGITPDHFAATPLLANFFDVLAVDPDKNSKYFVAMIEGKNLPIYGVQFHPEKNVFEWWPEEVMQHTAQAVQASQYLGNFLVGEARYSSHQFPSESYLDQYVIYNYNATFTDNEFEQCYLFNFTPSP